MRRGTKHAFANDTWARLYYSSSHAASLLLELRELTRQPEFFHPSIFIASLRAATRKLTVARVEDNVLRTMITCLISQDVKVYTKATESCVKIQEKILVFKLVSPEIV